MQDHGSSHHGVKHWYRLPFKDRYGIEGCRCKFTVTAALITNFPDNKVDVSLPLPANLDFGISYEFNDKLMIGLDLNYVFWKVLIRLLSISRPPHLLFRPIRLLQSFIQTA